MEQTELIHMDATRQLTNFQDPFNTIAFDSPAGNTSLTYCIKFGQIKEFKMTNKTEEENYQKFLNGVFWIKGWNARAKEILKAVPDDNKAETKQLLNELAEKIGREWAKGRDIRKIDSDMLKRWGDKLKEAIALSPAHLVKQLRILESDVNKILSKKS